MHLVYRIYIYGSGEVHQKEGPHRLPSFKQSAALLVWSKGLFCQIFQFSN